MAFKKGQGGRPKGSANKATVELKELARAYTLEALDTIVAIMRNPKGFSQARAMAAREVLDRGHGKSAQALAVTGSEGGPVTVIVEHRYVD